MNWDAIGAIGQILGSAAVFLTLIYLAVQLRESREEVRRTVRQNRADASSRLMLTLATDPRLSEIEERANVALGSAPNAISAEFIARTGLPEADARSLIWFYNAQWQTRTPIITYAHELTQGQQAMLDRTTRLIY
jgi:hypothetical protein